MTPHLGLVGHGAIGAALLDLLTGDLAPERVSLLVRPGRAGRGGTTAVDSPGALIAARPDLLVESAGHAAVREVVIPALRAGIDCIVVSVGALADAALESDLRAAARAGDARAILPAGAIGGIDLLSALSAAGNMAVTYRGTKPPRAWAGTPAQDALDLAALTAPATFFTGTARQAAALFPKNANVAATLALAGAGFDATRVELIADPAATGNLHAYEVTSPLGGYAMRIENRASAGNARTSAATVLSVLRAIRNRTGHVVI